MALQSNFFCWLLWLFMSFKFGNINGCKGPCPHVPHFLLIRFWILVRNDIFMKHIWNGKVCPTQCPSIFCWYSVHLLQRSLASAICWLRLSVRRVSGFKNVQTLHNYAWFMPPKLLRRATFNIFLIQLAFTWPIKTLLNYNWDLQEALHLKTFLFIGILDQIPQSHVVSSISILYTL